MGLVTLNGPKGKSLRAATNPVDDIATQVIPYLDEAKHVLEREHGVGLAAPQIGVPYAWYVDTLGTVYINPVIEEITEDGDDESNGPVSVFEGCLSLPERWFKTTRQPKVVMRFTDVLGDEQLLTFSGVSAWVAQHECDHLRGVLVSDHGTRVYKGDE